MALSKEEILDAIAEMSVIDIVDLIEAMEEKFGVSAAAPVAAAAPAAAASCRCWGRGCYGSCSRYSKFLFHCLD